MTRIKDNKEFTEFVTLVSVTPMDIVPRQRTTRSLSTLSWVRSHLLFLLIVAFPGLLGVVYYGVICTDQYVSETQFVVRSPNHNAAGLLSGFLQSTGFVRAQDDSYIVSEFMLSRGAMDELVRDDGLKDILSRPEADFLTRFPAPWSRGNGEELFRYYKRAIDINTNSSSGVTTLQVKAVRADDAEKLANALLQHAEGLVNRLNDRARQDAIRYAQIELQDSQDQMSKTQKSLTDFRNREAVVDPNKQSAVALDMIARLSDEVADDQARLKALDEQAPRSPQREALGARVTAVERQISDERARIVGGDNSMAPRIAQYEQLLLEREMAAKMLASAATSLENAKIDAQRQQLYLERISEPNLPDHPLYPKRLGSILMLLAVCFSIFWIVRFLSRQVLEHADSQ